MFAREVRELIQGALDLFAHAIKIPIELYELDDKGRVLSTLRSDE